MPRPPRWPAVAKRFLAGESIGCIAAYYWCSTRKIEDALRRAFVNAHNGATSRSSWRPS